jgi:hypothetical protein
MPNPNHPVKDSQTKVDPIKSIKDIKSIKKLLKNNLRDYALFIIGVNTNLRASDLVGIHPYQPSRYDRGESPLPLFETTHGHQCGFLKLLSKRFLNFPHSLLAFESAQPPFAGFEGA